MKDLSTAEASQVSGGIAPVVWFAAGIIARSAIGTAAKSAAKTAFQAFVGGAVAAALRE